MVQVTILANSGVMVFLFMNLVRQGQVVNDLCAGDKPLISQAIDATSKHEQWENLVNACFNGMQMNQFFGIGELPGRMKTFNT